MIGRALREALLALLPGTSRSAAPGGRIARAPALTALENAAVVSRSKLEPYYWRYVSSVSSPVWALSLETAAVLHALCVLVRPRMAVDLGSGFSSALLRLYARDAETPCTVHSADDDPRWLERTRGFLADLNLSCDGLRDWAELAVGQARYDLVLHDLGSMSVRAQTLPEVLRLRAPAGLVVLDDMHKDPYGEGARNTCAEAGLRVIDLRELTLDRYGRYACLAGDPMKG